MKLKNIEEANEKFELGDSVWNEHAIREIWTEWSVGIARILLLIGAAFGFAMGFLVFLVLGV